MRTVAVVAVVAVVAGLLLAVPGCNPCARAAAPPADSEEGQALHGHDAWFHGLTSPGGDNCCSIADCRAVEVRITGDGHYQVRFIFPQDTTGAGAPRIGVWYDVSERAVIHAGGNPTGYAIACWSPGMLWQNGRPIGHIRCFKPVEWY